MKVSDYLTLVAVLAAGTGAYFAYDSWEKFHGKPFDEAARNPNLFRYVKGRPNRFPLVPTRINRENELKSQLAVLAQETSTHEELVKTKNGLIEDNKVLSEEILAATTEKQELQDTIRDKNRVINDNQERIRQLEEATAVTGNPEELKATVQDNIRRLNEANAALAREKDTLAAALKRKADQEAALQAARRKESMQQAGEMEPDFRTTVREVFGRWGFVVINGGTSRGVNARTKLDVTRGEAKIAELQVTTVEPTVSVCAIVPGSVQGDVTLAPGDKISVTPVKASAPIVEAPPVGAPAAAPAAEPAAAPAAMPEAQPADPLGF